MRHILSALAGALALAFAGCASTPAAPQPVATGPDAVLMSMLVSEGKVTTLTPRVVIHQGSHAAFSTDGPGSVEVLVHADPAPGQHALELRYTRDGALVSNPRLVVSDDQPARIDIGEGADRLSFEVLARSVDTLN